VRASLLALALLRAAAAFLPSMWAWGLDAQRFLAPRAAWLPWLVMALAILPAVGAALAVTAILTALARPALRRARAVVLGLAYGAMLIPVGLGGAQVAARGTGTTQGEARAWCETHLGGGELLMQEGYGAPLLTRDEQQAIAQVEQIPHFAVTVGSGPVEACVEERGGGRHGSTTEGRDLSDT